MAENPVLQAFAEQVAEDFPDLKAVMDQAKAGTLTEMDALRAMSEILGSNPDLAERFQQMSRDLMAPLVADPDLPDDPTGLVIHKKRGLPQLNPLVEAALIERAQFDEDMPELRSGGLTPGVAPAVSVDTKVRSPEALGLMLAQASQQVAEAIDAKEPARRAFITQMAEGDLTALALMEQSGQALTLAQAQDMVFDGQSAAMDVPEYRRGQVPVPLVVETPTGSALLAMTPQERKQGAWKFLSTTQGRRTAVDALAELVEVKLRGEGFQVSVRPYTPGSADPVQAVHEWSVGIDGPGAVQAAFNLIDNAAASITKGLTRKMGEQRGKVILEVTAINTVDVRSVGWAGRLLLDLRGTLPVVAP